MQLYKKRKIMQGRSKSGKQALNLTEEMVRLVVMMSVSCDDLISQVYEMNRSGSASGGYSSGLEAAYHNYGMDMESWKSDKYSHGRYKVREISQYVSGVDGVGVTARELQQQRRRNSHWNLRLRRSLQSLPEWPLRQLEDGVEPDLQGLPDHPLPLPHLLLHDQGREKVGR